MKTVYRLKPMISVRIAAEIVALLICGIVPLVGTFSGFLSRFPDSFRLSALGACVVAWILLPFYGFITWSVESDELGITARSLFEREFCKWEDIKSLRLLANWNSSRYVVTTQQGKELTFPIWIKACEALVQQIREKLPPSGGAEAAPRHFRHSSFSLAAQILQTVLGLIFAGVFWFFVLETFIPKSPSWFDCVFVVGFAILLSAAMLWRSFRIALMPTEVETSNLELGLKSPFYNLRLQWKEILKLILAPPLLPEGYILRTKRGDFFLSAAIEASDELVKQIEQNSGTVLLQRK
jgi:hypothetical protein